MLISFAGFLAVTALFALLVAHEIIRVSAPSVRGSHRPSIWGKTISGRTELLLWTACAGLLLPRVIELLT